MGTSKNSNKKQTFLGLFFIYASNEPKSVLARDLGVAKRHWRLATTETECRGRDNLRNSRSAFLIVENINSRIHNKAHY